MKKRFILRNNTFLFALASTLFGACTAREQVAEPLGRDAVVCPDYAEVTLPINIAAPTFVLADSLMLQDAQAVFSSGNATVVVAADGEEGFCIDADDWHSLVRESGAVSVRIQGTKDGKWVEYNAFNIYISPDSIDSYLAYRLIEPGYEQWNEMGIYQRNLETYDEEAILTNKQTNGGCMNCHTFHQYDPAKMLFHLRKDYAGTYFVDKENVDKITPTPSFVYPSWHPSGRFVAFSTNETKQMFHTTDVNRIEVFDYSSDLLVYDTQTGETLTCEQLHSDSMFETFPSWSPDGKALYFCSADSVLIPDEYDKLKYSLCRISFDDNERKFGDVVDTLYSAKANDKSVSFPRVSPDGTKLVFTVSDYGTFSIWHKEAQLYMIDLQNKKGETLVGGETLDTKAQSARKCFANRASYHTWSSNGKWLIFSSRQDDGLYTRPYITHIGADGQFSKPFVVPQQDADFYNRTMKSFNIPEFIKGKVQINRENLSRLLK